MLIDQVVVKELLLFQPIFQKVMPELFYLLLGNRNGRLLIRGFFLASSSALTLAASSSFRRLRIALRSPSLGELLEAVL